MSQKIEFLKRLEAGAIITPLEALKVTQSKRYQFIRIRARKLPGIALNELLRKAGKSF